MALALLALFDGCKMETPYSLGSLATQGKLPLSHQIFGFLICIFCFLFSSAPSFLSLFLFLTLKMSAACGVRFYLLGSLLLLCNNLFMPFKTPNPITRSGYVVFHPSSILQVCTMCNYMYANNNYLLGKCKFSNTDKVPHNIIPSKYVIC
ncbi:hypothetical protein ASPWEDRAFT_256582 [Aspergillus wentii DTO 134E9]|uniref:Uncharacterized protein n=1 Tax=Aspergillus wentii DTO 134E9 TaxID=1073089 RepID=A0A1L9S2A7_ASPWE|nr:uncharacterized protein ASPWEDRAFT_256582 [Aspergillus wentii DTO 134E9]OJJ41293.1 hypothetical protein ASPWEDRAFT_256582 [Aspergillus wentii DTO 134E9]